MLFTYEIFKKSIKNNTQVKQSSSSAEIDVNDSE